MRLYIVFIFALLTACTSSQKTEVCQEADWYELGRRGGAMGEEVKFKESNLPILCKSSDPQKYHNMYLNGRNEGLIEFCRLGGIKHGENSILQRDINDKYLSLLRFLVTFQTCCTR